MGRVVSTKHGSGKLGCTEVWGIVMISFFSMTKVFSVLIWKLNRTYGYHKEHCSRECYTGFFLEMSYILNTSSLIR